MLIKHEHVLTNDDKFSGLLSAYSSTHGPSPYFPQQSYFSFRAASPNPSLVSLLWLGFQIFDEDSTTVQHHYHPGLGIIYSVYNSPYIQGRLSSCSTSATTTTCPYTLYLHKSNVPVQLTIHSTTYELMTRSVRLKHVSSVSFLVLV